MSDSCDTFSNTTEEASDATVGVHFIHLEDVYVSEEQQQDTNERQELRRRLNEAATLLREKRENHDRLFEHALELEALINETKAENKYLTGKVKEFQQQVENIRKRREEEEGEELLSEEENRKLRNQLIHIWKMEKENEKLREKTEDLTAELEQLSLGPKYQEQIQRLRTAEQELKHNLEQVQEVLCRKDDEIEKKSMTLIQFNNKTEESLNTIMKLKQDQQKLQKQLSRRQGEQILAWNTSTMDKEGGEDKDERPLMNKMWSCLKSLWEGVKVGGCILLCVLLLVGIIASMVPVCNCPDPDCNLWDIAFNLLEPYGQLHQTLRLY